MRIKNTAALLVTFFTTVLSQLFPNPIPQYSLELETDLRDKLFDGYKVMQRPQQRVPVRTSLSLLSLNYLDIKEQKMSVTAYFYFTWIDQRLVWKDNRTYDNVRFLFSTELSMWRPPLIVENSDNVDVISKPAVPLRVRRNGLVTWLPAGIFTTHCESYVTYWPLDTQTCEIILSSWSYTGNEVDLMFDELEKGINMEFYQEHGEWELMNKTHTLLSTEREFESFSRLVFTFTFRRRPLFHTLNTLFPVVLMGFLTVAIFKLSPESGERVGLALTILLAYAVYLSLISENIPQTSRSASLLSSYLAAILFLQTFAVLLTVFYLDMYFSPVEKPVPRWLQTVSGCCLARLVCVNRCGSRCCASSIKPDNVKNISNHDFKGNINSIETGPEIINESGGKSVEAWIGDVNDDVTKEYSWKEIALMFDKLTMYIYLVFVTTLTVVSLTIMAKHYHNAYSSS